MGATLSVWRQGCQAVQHGSVTCERTARLLQELQAGGCCDAEQATALLLAADRICDRVVRLVASACPADKGAQRQLVPLYLGYCLSRALSGEPFRWLAASRHAAIIDLIERCWRALLQGESVIDSATWQQWQRDFLQQQRLQQQRGDDPDLEWQQLALQYVHAPLPGEQLVVFLDTLSPDGPALPAVAHWWRGEDTGLVLPHAVLTETGSAARSALVDTLQHTQYDTRLYDAGDPAACFCALMDQARQLQALHQQVVAGERNYPLPLPIALCQQTATADSVPGPCMDTLRFPVVPKRSRHEAVVSMAVHLPELPAFWSLEPGEQMAPVKTVDFWFQYLVETNFCLRPRIAAQGELAGALFANSYDSLHYRDKDPASEGRTRAGGIIRSDHPAELLASVLANAQGINLLLAEAGASAGLLPVLDNHLLVAGSTARQRRLNLPLVLATRGPEPLALAEDWLRRVDPCLRVFYPWDANSTVMVMNQMFREHGQLAAVVTPIAELPVCSSGREAYMAADRGAVWLLKPAGASVQILATGAAAVQAAVLAAQQLEQRGECCALLAILEPARFCRAGIEGLSAGVEKRLFVTHTHSDTLIPVLKAAMRGLRADDAHWLLLQDGDRRQQSRQVIKALTAHKNLKAVNQGSSD